MKILARLAGVSALVLALAAPAFSQTLLNVSYDPTRELYADFNAAFVKYWKAKTGQTVTIQQSHGGSGGQARAVIDGLEADVVTLALAYDIDAIAAERPDQPGLAEAAAAEQRALHLDDRVPGAQGQSEGHQGLGRSGEAGHRGHHAEPEDVRRRALELPRGVGLREAAARRQRRQGAGVRRAAVQERAGARLGRARRDDDVRPARHRRRAAGVGERGVPGARRKPRTRSRSSMPSISILAEPPVAVVDKVVDRKGTRAVAEAYLQYLYSPEGQEIAAKHHYRPRDAEGRGQVRRASFAKVKLFTIDEAFGGWQTAQKTHFADGGMFDQIYKPGARR